MNQSDRTELVLIFIALLVTIVFGLTMGIGDRFDVDQFVAALTPDLGVLSGADVVADAVPVMLLGDLAVDVRLLFDS